MKNFLINSSENVNVTIEETKDNEVYKIVVDFSAADKVSPIKIEWKEKMTNIYSVWTPLGDRNRNVKQWFAPTKNVSSFCSGSPILTTVGYDEKNRTTVSLSEFVKSTEISFSVDDINQKEEVTYTVVLFQEKTDYVKKYESYMRIDERDIPYYTAIQDCAKWFSCFINDSLSVPESATLPLYSTWYNFHQFPTQNELLQELEVAQKLGFKTVILDDGWQYDGESTGDYRNCGNWQVSKTKFPDFEYFINKTHEYGLKIMVWFPVPFIGFCTSDYVKYKEKMLYVNEEYKAGIVDVRYKEVREYVVNNYVNFVKKYNIDGLKLDFIDSFFAPTFVKANYNEEMDKQTVEQGVIALLEEIKEKLTQAKQDFLIEFRQNYIGAKIVSYANMLRVLDCAYDSITNRIGIVDLRLLNTQTAIHSDMLFWGKEENIENCAKQLLNIMFGVPQISVKLTESSTEQIKLIKHFLNYYTENKEIISKGSFSAYNPELNYSKVKSETNKKSISVLYSQNDHVYTGKQEDVFNCTDNNYIIVDPNNHLLDISVFNLYGEKLNDYSCSGLVKINVEIGGYISIKQH